MAGEAILALAAPAELDGLFARGMTGETFLGVGHCRPRLSIGVWIVASEAGELAAAAVKATARK